MIIDFLLYLFGTIISWLSLLLPTFSVYPPEFLSGISFFGGKIASLNFFIFDVPKTLGIFIFLIQFEVYYFTAQKIVSILNFFRGSGKLEI